MGVSLPVYHCPGLSVSQFITACPQSQLRWIKFRLRILLTMEDVAELSTDAILS